MSATNLEVFEPGVAPQVEGTALDPNLHQVRRPQTLGSKPVFSSWRYAAAAVEANKQTVACTLQQVYVALLLPSRLAHFSSGPEACRRADLGALAGATGLGWRVANLVLLARQKRAYIAVELL